MEATDARRDKKVEDREKPRSYRGFADFAEGDGAGEICLQLSGRFPVDERYGLIPEIRTAAVSVPSNIAEELARHTTKEFLPFLSHPQGSLAEVQAQLRLRVDLGFANQERIAPGLKEVDELQNRIATVKRKLEVASPLATRHSPLPAVRH